MSHRRPAGCAGASGSNAGRRRAPAAGSGLEPSARVLSFGWHSLSFCVETTTKGRGGCSRMAVSPTAARASRHPAAQLGRRLCPHAEAAAFQRRVGRNAAWRAMCRQAKQATCASCTDSTELACRKDGRCSLASASHAALLLPPTHLPRLLLHRSRQLRRFGFNGTRKELFFNGRDKKGTVFGTKKPTFP